ncbi:hypothetical protein LCGC14_2245130 [marine sediment metagenome]|uniref:Uncharacterized protein n=1 Tax=marine sediment metagenome TaxID=412755 RepID=A0A0F9D3Z6_9ZZZZ
MLCSLEGIGSRILTDILAFYFGSFGVLLPFLQLASGVTRGLSTRLHAACSIARWPERAAIHIFRVLHSGRAPREFQGPDICIT